MPDSPRPATPICAALAACLGASLALACQEPPTPQGKPKAAEKAGAAAGGSAVAEPLACSAPPLEAELASFCEFDLGVPPIELPRVPWSAPSYHPLATRVITLDNSGLTDPEGEGTVSIQEWLADPPRRIPEPGVMVLAIAANVPATTVAELQRGLAAAHRVEVRYLVHASDERPIPQPRKPEMLAAMAEQLPEGPNERVMFVAQSMREYAQNCSALGEVFGQLAKVAPGERCTTLATGAAQAIVECGCTDLPEVMTMLYALTMGFQPPKGRAVAVPVMLDPNAQIRPAEGATWGEIAAQQLTGTELHHMWIDAVAPPAAATKTGADTGADTGTGTDSGSE